MTDIVVSFREMLHVREDTCRILYTLELSFIYFSKHIPFSFSLSLKLYQIIARHQSDLQSVFIAIFLVDIEGYNEEGCI